MRFVSLRSLNDRHNPVVERGSGATETKRTNPATHTNTKE